ncbi:MAG: OB-fold domain-containing protein [Acidimicrobiales bacterium]|nr:OB-fold domain-containing protein [Acidimicrobiales bacterium]
MRGIVSYGTYVPYWRLRRAAVGQALGTLGGPGTRSVASYDEDTTSMGVEAARLALRAAPGLVPQVLFFATAAPAYLDKTNATAIHAALGLPVGTGAFDVIGSPRSAVAATSAAMGAGGPALAVFADVRTGLPGGADEQGGGDAAAALLFGDEGVLAEPIGGASATGEFLDRWRVPGEPCSRQWEERFGEHAYLPLVQVAVTDALEGAGLSVDDVDHLVVTGLHGRAVRSAGRAIRAEVLSDDLQASVGNTGTAHWGLVLANVLDRATPGQVIAVVQLADGADCWLLRTTEALAAHRPASTVAEQIAAGRDDLPYASFLTWRGMLTREPPRRPDPDRPSAPPSLRTDGWKFAFEASRCARCGARHLPPARVCVACKAVDQMEPERLSDVPATVATYTVDRLAYSLNPPVVAAVVDFDGGGRFQCELTDVDPARVAIGDRVEMTFRRLYTVDGVHNYFWKARPVHRSGGGS